MYYGREQDLIPTYIVVTYSASGASETLIGLINENRRYKFYIVCDTSLSGMGIM